MAVQPPEVINVAPAIFLWDPSELTHRLRHQEVPNIEPQAVPYVEHQETLSETIEKIAIMLVHFPVVVGGWVLFNVVAILCATIALPFLITYNITCCALKCLGCQGAAQSMETYREDLIRGMHIGMHQDL